MLGRHNDWRVDVFAKVRLPSACKKPPDDFAAVVSLALAEAGDPRCSFSCWAKVHRGRFAIGGFGRDRDGELRHWVFACQAS